MKKINSNILNSALSLLESRMRRHNCSPMELVICGGSALIATGALLRSTRDLDVVAVIDSNRRLADPEPLPKEFIMAANDVESSLGFDDWIDLQAACLFRMGLPEGFQDRLICHQVGSHLKVHFISRIDQIFFKLYASVDRGGYHIDDLKGLNPVDNELIQAAKWSMTHDVSEGYAFMLKSLLIQLGYENVASGI